MVFILRLLFSFVPLYSEYDGLKAHAGFHKRVRIPIWHFNAAQGFIQKAIQKTLAEVS